MPRLVPRGRLGNGLWSRHRAHKLIGAMPSLETIKMWTEIGQNVAVAFAAIVTAYFGARGLTTWRHELTGKVKFEAARSILKALYEARDAAYGLLGALRPVPWASYKEQNQRWTILNEKLRALQSLSMDMEINFRVRMHDKILPLLSLGAACDQMMLETGDDKMTVEQLQHYLKPSLKSHITETVDNIESVLTRHIR